LGELAIKEELLITIKLSGGLGNQMFQYALGIELANKHKTSLRLDASSYRVGGGITWRKFLLSDFNINAEISADVISENLFRRVQSKYEAFLPYYLRSTIHEIGFEFDKKILLARNNCYLNGYWQSEKYFLRVASFLRGDFSLKKAFQGPLLELAEFIKERTSASVHFRRGDYVSNSTVNNIHGICDLDYYERAVNLLKEKYGDLLLIVFSDDQQWVRQNFKSDLQIYFVDDNYRASEEILLMSLCKHNIIANSTFSWWGAWLNQHKEKTVIAPQKWFSTTERNTNDLLPASWIRM
jgi:hypothetical protein